MSKIFALFFLYIYIILNFIVIYLSLTYPWKTYGLDYMSYVVLAVTIFFAVQYLSITDFKNDRLDK